MESTSLRVGDERLVAAGLVPVAAESPVSAVSWAAIIGGAFAIAAIGLILLALGAGLGFASVSPWSGSGASATTFTVAAAIWLLVVQWLSAAFGGYLTGRLRTKWVSVHSDEIYFRDTAHGFLAWAVAAVITAAVLASATSSVIGGAARVVGTAAQSAAPGSTANAASGSPALDPTAYLVNELFRSDHPDLSASLPAARAEATPIIVRGLSEGGMPAADKAYLTRARHRPHRPRPARRRQTGRRCRRPGQSRVAEGARSHRPGAQGGLLPVVLHRLLDDRRRLYRGGRGDRRRPSPGRDVGAPLTGSSAAGRRPMRGRAGVQGKSPGTPR